MTEIIKLQIIHLAAPFLRDKKAFCEKLEYRLAIPDHPPNIPRGAVGSMSEVLGLMPVPRTFYSPSPDSRRAFVRSWGKYVHLVLVNCLGGLCLPRNSVVRLNDLPDMTIDVYHGLKKIKQEQHASSLS